MAIPTMYSSAGDMSSLRPDPGSAPAVDVELLRDRIARLSLICEALWEIVKEKNALPPDLINLKVAELDMTDGKLNGRKASIPMFQCQQCNRVLPAGHQSCLYCGAFCDQATVFNGFI